MKSIKIEVKKTIPDYAVGQSIKVDTDADGVPLRKFWRDRLLDAKTDGCIEIVKAKPAKTTQSSSQGDK